MTIKEINDVFGINILERNRSLIYIYIKNIYINQQYEKEIPLLHIAGSLGLNHAAVINSIKNNKVYGIRQDFIDIKKAYEEKSTDKLDLDYSNMKRYKDPLVRATLIRVRIKNNMPEKRWHSSKIIEILNKYQDHRLWNVPMIDYTKENYKTLELLKSKIIE